MSRHRQSNRVSLQTLSGADRVLLFGVVVLLLLAPWPLGLNRDWAWPLWCAGVFVLAVVALLWPESQTERRTKFGLPWPWWLFCAAWLLVDGFAVVMGEFNASIGAEAWPSDPDSAWRALAKDAAGISIASFAFRLSMRSAGRVWLFYALFAVGALQAGYGVAKALSHSNDALMIARGSFINQNHFSGFLEMCAGAALGMMLGQLQTHAGERNARAWLSVIDSPRLLVRLGLILMVLGIVMSRSRGGNGAFFAAITVIGVLSFFVLKPRPPMLPWFLASIVVIDVLLIGGKFGTKAVERIQQTEIVHVDGRPTLDAERRFLNHASWAMFQERPWLGWGPGSYRTAFPSRKPERIQLFYDHAHNDHLQFLVERGVLGALPVWLLVIGGVIRLLQGISRQERIWDRGLALGALAALLSIGIHSFSDFNLQIPANAMIFLTFLGMIWGLGSPKSHENQLISGRRERGAVLGLPETESKV